MTGGRLKRVLPYVGDEDFCFTYGDGLADVDIGDAGRVPSRSRARSPRSPPCSRPAASARCEIDGDARRGLPREARRRRRLDQRRLLRALDPRVVDYIDGDDDRLGAGAAAGASRPTAQLSRLRARRLLAADGHAARASS